LAKVDAFIAEHPDYTRQGVRQPGQGATNRVFFARRGRDLVVFKVFCEVERKERECFGLRHWRDTGLVPDLIWDADPTMIVMSHVPGVYLRVARKLEGEAVWRESCRETGRAAGLLTRVPLTSTDQAAFESRFYAGIETLENYLGRILVLGRSVHARDLDFRDAFWRESLDFTDSRLGGILSQTPVLYHQDASNLNVWRGRFMGFYDLEMCRVGCAAMQLASSFGMLDGERAAWEPFRQGWETATDEPIVHQDLSAAAAGYHLLCWREISRYLSYNGTPRSGFGWASPADPVSCRESIESMENMIDLARR
jgi:hypothetical protein